MEIGSILEINPESLFDNKRNIPARLPFMSESEEWNIDFFNTGRSAIEAILKALEIEKIWLPSFICNSVIDAVKRSGCEICYYPVNTHLEVDINFFAQNGIDSGDVFYVMEYFGLTISEEVLSFIEDIHHKGVIVFEDITMSLLSSNPESFAFGDYVLGSIRKWIPIPDGAFLASKHNLPEMPKENAAYDYTLYYFVAQIMKWHYLKNPDVYDKNVFLEFSNKGIQSLFSDYRIRRMSDIALSLMQNEENWEKHVTRRRSNYEKLYELLKQIPQIRLLNKCEEGMIPMGMFILTENRDGLLNHLIESDIYCNVHWRQNEATELFDGSAYLARHCITIPCDYRYDNEAMLFIYENVKNFWES